jgi:hypothetical protein
VTRVWFCAGLVATALAVLVQSAAHLAATLPFDDIGSIVDLDRSNSIPDVLSTVVIATAAAGAIVLAARRNGVQRAVAALLAAATGLVAAEDALHRDVGDSSPTELLVLASAALTAVLIAAIGSRESNRVRAALLVGLVLLVGDVVVGHLDQVIPWLERDRGERIAELVIVAKQGLELAGWALIALGIWDAALRSSVGSTADVRRTASRRPAPSKRHAA